MFKKIKERKHQCIKGLASECEVLEKTISESIVEIMRIVDSINLEMTDSINVPETILSDKEVINEEQGRAT